MPEFVHELLSFYALWVVVGAANIVFYKKIGLRGEDLTYGELCIVFAAVGTFLVARRIVRMLR